MDSVAPQQDRIQKKYSGIDSFENKIDSRIRSSVIQELIDSRQSITEDQRLNIS
jgi:hypothetical protein